MKIQLLTKFVLGRSGFVFVHYLIIFRYVVWKDAEAKLVVVENLLLQESFLGTHDSIRLNLIFLNAAERHMCKFTLNICVYM